MATEKSEDTSKKSGLETGLKPDPETLHTTDPQEHMSGPLSSLMNKAKDAVDDDEQVEGQEQA
ncbi:MAG TPA: hypothetical protein VEZ17_09125 [Chitinophagaceae bacterium]|jgi:hypothetical protein|nr:hypothetical protein [Chitinophagaceae bacterium]